MRATVRRTAGGIVVLQGALHLIGAAAAFRWPWPAHLERPAGPLIGAAWLGVAALLVVTGVLLAKASPGWWAVGAAAAAASQALIMTSWSTAWVGSLVNGVVLLAAIHGFAAYGPRSYRTEYRRRVEAVWAVPPEHDPSVIESDLDGLPPPVAAYLRTFGAVGQPRVANFRAQIHGRIRAGSSKPWMKFTGEQVNTYGRSSGRLFFMQATMFGLPVDVLHILVGARATMRVRLCSLLPMVNAAGPDLDRAETVTLFNDMCVLAPAALIFAPVDWASIDEYRVSARFTNGAHTICAALVFNDQHELVDFISDDRTRASANGRSFTAQRWSTPVTRYCSVGGHRIATYGQGRWHAPKPEGEFSYLEFYVDSIAYNVTSNAEQVAGSSTVISPRSQDV